MTATIPPRPSQPGVYRLHYQNALGQPLSVRGMFTPRIMVEQQWGLQQRTTGLFKDRLFIDALTNDQYLLVGQRFRHRLNVWAKRLKAETASSIDYLTQLQKLDQAQGKVTRHAITKGDKRVAKSLFTPTSAKELLKDHVGHAVLMRYTKRWQMGDIKIEPGPKTFKVIAVQRPVRKEPP